MELRYRNFRVLRMENMKDFEKKIFIIITKLIIKIFYINYSILEKSKKKKNGTKLNENFQFLSRKISKPYFNHEKKKRKRKNAYKIPKLIPVQQVQPSVSTVIDTDSGANK